VSLIEAAQLADLVLDVEDALGLQACVAAHFS
jgi:hypothetical protein